MFRFLEWGKTEYMQAVKGLQVSSHSQCAAKSHLPSLAACLCPKRDLQSENLSFGLSIFILALQTQAPMYHLQLFSWGHSCFQNALKFLLKVFSLQSHPRFPSNF